MNRSTSSSNEINPINISNYKTLNSTNISKASTIINQSESYLLNNLLKNNDSINFRKDNLKLKKKFLHKISKDIDSKYSYKNLVFQKKLKYNNKSSELNLLNPYDINKKFLLPKSNSTTNIKFDSVLTQRIQDEILYEKNSKYNFIKKIENIMFIKKFLYEQKKLYEKEIQNNKSNALFLKKINKKISYLKYILKENENIFEINKYIKFLIEKRIEMKNENLFFSTQIDCIKEDNKVLLIKIREKSEKLWDLFEIRNLLICIKEKIFMNNLPLIFHFCNSSFLTVLIKKYNNYVDLLESRNKYVLNNPLIKYKIPTNLVEYIYSKMKSKIEEENYDKNLLKYLDPKFIIFENVDEFLKAYIDIEEKTIDYYFNNYLIKKNNNEIMIKHNTDKVNLIKSENKDILDMMENLENIAYKLKQKNIYLDNFFLSLKREYNSKYEIEFTNKKEKESNQNKLNNLFLRSIENTVSPERNKFLFFLNNLKIEKKFKIHKFFFSIIKSSNNN